ncbi:glutamate ABC transporter substrate-binding protein [Saccharothrix sp. S26]|uniref:glutamate ABC transporter substrate-binding protein n=1 Tax=Saccharothrix sp. S26 TaxID=2907215 RepID=UPI001F2B2344|nr:glutamate ABC transporter substrate-binding protein [Saccharothrix sp. S26]MCE6998387.1 glutamate ABC transporter substrate-binding protein [Saccharothrix sp. S26]
MRRCAVAALTAAVALVAGCASAAPVPARPQLSLAAPRPPGMVAPSDINGAKDPTECPEGKGPFVPERSSLRPAGPLPPPGTRFAGGALGVITQRGKLVVGVDQHLSKFGSVNPLTGELEGFDVDIAKEIAKALFGDETAVEFVEVNFTDNFDKLAARQVDLLADSITITCERRYTREVMFSTDYFFSGQRVMVAKTSTVKGIEDLRGKRVCAPDGTTSIGRITDPARGLVPVAVREFSDCLVLLQEGQVDAISSTDSVLLGLTAQDPTTHMVGPRFSEEHHGLAMRETDEDLVRYVNAVLERLRADGTWSRLYAKWLADLEPVLPSPPPALYVD